MFQLLSFNISNVCHWIVSYTSRHFQSPIVACHRMYIYNAMINTHTKKRTNDIEWFRRAGVVVFEQSVVAAADEVQHMHISFFTLKCCVIRWHVSIIDISSVVVDSVSPHHLITSVNLSIQMYKNSNVNYVRTTSNRSVLRSSVNISYVHHQTPQKLLRTAIQWQKPSVWNSLKRYEIVFIQSLRNWQFLQSYPSIGSANMKWAEKKNNYENALDIVSWMVCDKHVAWLLVILWLLTFAASYFEERHHTAP